MAIKLKHNIIETYDITTLGILDVSTYQGSPSNVTLEITVPGYNKTTAGFTYNHLNIYTAFDLGIDCDEDDNVALPDGIYRVKYSISPNSKNYVGYSFMRVSAIMCRYMRAYASIDLECSCTEASKTIQKRKLDDILLLINSSIAAAKQNDEVYANKMYAKADRLLKRISHCDCL